jgi:hypothetical protein
MWLAEKLDWKGLILQMLLVAVRSSVVNEFMVTVNFKPPCPGHFSKFKTSELWKG